jgi:hypothetical protein
MNCPRCQSELSERRVAVVSVQSCEHCGGLWCRPWDLPKLLNCDVAEIQQLTGEEEAAELGPIHCPQHGGMIGRLCSSVLAGPDFHAESQRRRGAENSIGMSDCVLREIEIFGGPFYA